MGQPIAIIDSNSLLAPSVLCFNLHEELTGRIILLEIYKDKIIGKQVVVDDENIPIYNGDLLKTQDILMSFIYIDDLKDEYLRASREVQIIYGRDDVKWSSANRKIIENILIEK